MIAFFFARPRLIIIYHTRRDGAKSIGTNTGRILDFGPIRGKTADGRVPDIMLNEHNASLTSKGIYATQMTLIHFLRRSRTLRSSMFFGLPGGNSETVHSRRAQENGRKDRRAGRCLRDSGHETHQLLCPNAHAGNFPLGDQILSFGHRLPLDGGIALTRSGAPAPHFDITVTALVKGTSTRCTRSFGRI